MFGIGCRVVEVHAGEILSFPAGQDHVLLQGSRDLSFLAIGIKSDFCGDILRNQRVRVPLPMFLKAPAGEFQRLVSGISAVAGSAEKEQGVAELWERVYGGGWGTLGHAGGELHVLTRRTLEALAVAPELGREDLARHARANPSEISRWFHRDLGATLVHFRTRLRLLKFIRQVDRRCGDLTAAANEAGFGSYSQCHRAFQAEFDCAPRQFFFSGLRERYEQAFAPFSGQSSDGL
jgi:AraC-like DNA-binding protein